MSTPTLRRATRNEPCQICGNTDWCSDGGNFVICMRVSIGAEKPTANGGWFHRVAGKPSTIRRRGIRTLFLPQQAKPELCGELATRYVDATWPAMLDTFAQGIGVSSEALVRLRAGWAFDIINKRGERHQAYDAGDAMRQCDNRGWSFPMVDHAGSVTGVRIRMESGDKFAVAGGREGLFVPADITPQGVSLLIAEGPTDTAALIDLGFQAVGRPSCTGGVSHMIQFVLIHKPACAVVVSDADVPGRLGAASLANSLLPYVASVKVIEPPEGVKDSRAWKRAGASHQEIEDAIGIAPVRQIKMQGKAVLNAA